MQTVGNRPECLCVAGILAAVSDKRHGVAALCGGSAHRHKAGGDLFHIFIPLNTLAFHHVHRFQYQLIFCVQVVTNGDGHAHGKMLNVVKNTLANAGNVHPQIPKM